MNVLVIIKLSEKIEDALYVRDKVIPQDISLFKTEQRLDGRVLLMEADEENINNALGIFPNAIRGFSKWNGEAHVSKLWVKVEALGSIVASPSKEAVEFGSHEMRARLAAVARGY